MAKGIVTFDEKYCKGCGLCVEACKKGLVALDNTRLTQKGYHPATITNPDECIACANCAIMCPDSAITVEKID